MYVCMFNHLLLGIQTNSLSVYVVNYIAGFGVLTSLPSSGIAGSSGIAIFSF